MILIAGIYIVAAMLVLNFFLGLKREVNYGIELKNIDLSNVSIQEQLDKIGIKADRVMQGYSKHLEKIKNRPR